MLKRRTTIATMLLALLFWGGFVLAAENLTEHSDQNYHPDPKALEALRAEGQPVEIVLFHGAWCRDCQREVPRFMRILELADNSRIVLTEYEVKPEKKDALGKFEEYGIRLVPTFIVFRQGHELGRIVEKPQRSLEEDLVTILGVQD